MSDLRGRAGHAAALAPPRAGVHSEAFLPDGTVRPHWRGLLDWMRETGRGGLDEAARVLARARSESGIAFGDGEGNGTRGEQDPLPVVISAAEWAVLEAGIAQRARLAEAALADLYGPRSLIAAGHLPPGIAFGTGSYAAHCAGWPDPPARRLYVYEADVARRADGSWVMLSDRLDAPLGDGWLIANRIAVSEAFSGPFLDLGVRRLASHYTRFQELLDSLTGWEGRLALLTGGEEDPRFFSHAYLARYLNAALVEPADVTVRDRAAFVKTLDGLKKIDVMLRGVPDRAVDALHRPLEAMRGAPSLSLAARSGALVLGNAIGASALAHRALAPFAPVIARELLGEELLIADGPCLWLGEADAREAYLADRGGWRLEHLTEGALVADLPEDDAPRRTTLARQAERLVATRFPDLGETPVWRDGALGAAPWMMRVFASWNGAGWDVAPGALATVVEPDKARPQLDFGKDVWVLADPDAPLPETPYSLLADRLATGHLRRTGRDLLSRVADEVFWLGRNSERAEATLRLLDVCLRRYLSGNRIDADPDLLARLVAIHAGDDASLPAPRRFREAVRTLISDPDASLGLTSTLAALRSGAVRARMSISEEGWHYIDRLSTDPRWRAGLDLHQSSEMARLIDDSLRNLAAFSGAAQENLTRNYAWRFLEMGRRIERGIDIARVATTLIGTRGDNEESVLRAWLTLSDSNSAYRTRYMMVPRAAAVLDLLVLDEANPRALAFQLCSLEEVLSELPREGPYRRAEHRKALALLTELRLLDADRLAETDEDGARTLLADLAARTRHELSEISDLVSRAFFAHSEAPEALVAQGKS